MSQVLKKQKKSNEGFTLIELMVSMVIIGILAGITMASSRSVRSGRSIGLAADQLISDIRGVQSLALSGGLAPYSLPDGSETEKPPCAFGIEFDSSTTYKIVYIYQNDKSTGDPVCGEELSDIIETNKRDFPDGTTDVQDIDEGLQISATKGKSIFFTLPGGEKFIWNNPDKDEVIINLTHRNNNQNREIRIKKNGSIEY